MTELLLFHNPTKKPEPRSLMPPQKPVIRFDREILEIKVAVASGDSYQGGWKQPVEIDSKQHEDRGWVTPTDPQ